MPPLPRTAASRPAAARLAAAVALLLLLPGCDAGHREAPGSDNAFQCPSVTVASPFEGQQVVPLKAGAPVLAQIDVVGGALGRGAGSRLRWRLERVDGAAQPPAGEAAWTTIDLPEKAVSLGVLAPGAYQLSAEVLRADGTPWTRVEPDAAGAPTTKNAASTAVRRFSVHAGWAAKDKP